MHCIARTVRGCANDNRQVDRQAGRQVGGQGRPGRLNCSAETSAPTRVAGVSPLNELPGVELVALTAWLPLKGVAVKMYCNDGTT